MSTPTSFRSIRITPRDPLIARDGRPFTAGNRMQSLDWFYPSVLAGSLRSILGKQANVDFNDPTVHDPLRAVSLRGPFPVVDQALYLPAPHDVFFERDKTAASGTVTGKVFASRPAEIGTDEGVDFPSDLLPPMLDLGSDETDFKPSEVPAFWSVDEMAKWLVLPRGNRQWSFAGAGFLKPAKKDQRFHVKITEGEGTAEDGQLFSTVGLDLTQLSVFDPQPKSVSSIDPQLLVRASAANGYGSQLDQVSQFHPLGGERRLAHWSSVVGADSTNVEALWNCPQLVADALHEESKKKQAPQRVRLVLATPGLFRTGWIPEWIGKDMTGTVPGTGTGNQVRLKLVSACVDRWRAVSGWNLEKNQPKATQRLVPAGSVYFFEVLSGDVSALKSTWLTPTYFDDSQPARDGFGLALWGIWEPHSSNE